MPDSSPQFHTHLGNFCTMSIWFSLPLNLPMSDLEKKKKKERGRSEMGGGVAKVMDKTESWCLGCGVRAEGAAGVTGCQLRLSQPLEGPSSCGYERLAMTEPPQAQALKDTCFRLEGREREYGENWWGPAR